MNTLRCFACRELFRDTSTEGTKARHGHHVIPRAFGGSKGPVVDICNEDHDLLHSLAQKILSKQMTVSQIPEYTQGEEHLGKITWLVTRVVNAALLTKNDANKRVAMSFVLTAEQASKLDDLKKVFNRTSRTATLLHLIETSHSARILLKP